MRWNAGQCVTHQTAGNDPLPLTLDQRGQVQLSQITHQLQTSPFCAATVDPDRNIKCKVKYSDLVNVCSPHIHWQVNISPVCGFLHPSNSGGLKARPKHLFYKYSFQKNVTCLFADKQITLLNHLEVSSQCEMTVSYIQLSEQERVTCWSVYRYTQGRGCGCQLAVSPEWRFPLRCQEEALEGVLCSPCTKSHGDPLSLPPHETARHAWQAFKDPPLKTPSGKGHQNNLEEPQAHCHPWDPQTEYLNGVLMVLNRKGWGINIKQGSLIESWPTAGRGGGFRPNMQN